MKGSLDNHKSTLRLLGLCLLSGVLFRSSGLQGASPPQIDDQALPSIEDSAPLGLSASGRNGLVVTTHREASKVGLAVLRQGGNAVDAAVAIGYALAVTDPCCGNLGGGGFMLIRQANGKTRFLDFRETAPLAISPDRFWDDRQRVITERIREGYLSVGVPGTVKGLEHARQRYGTLSRQILMKPAIALAESGYALQPGDVSIFQAGLRRLTLDPTVAAIFLQPNGQPFPAGTRLKQPDLAQTLRLIAKDGDTAFYQGAIAQAVAKASQAQGGILSLKDFETYRVRESAPLRCRYRGYTVLTSPLPGGGTTICQMLQILSGYPLQKMGWRSPETLHTLFSTMLLAYGDRNRFLGDPAFVKPPLQDLLSPDHAAYLRKQIPIDRAIPPETVYADIIAPEGTNTTHYSVIDRKGNAVSVTYTINGYFGSGMMAPKTGFLLNNEMDDFTIKPGVPNSFGLIQGRANLIAPGKRPLSSMSPTMLIQGNQLRLITGTPGGSTIPTTLVQMILQVVDYPRSLADAVAMPRVHYQGFPKVVMLEPNAISADVKTRLEKMGYTFWERSSWGAASSIGIDLETGLRTAVNDPRKPAGAAMAE
jgi:gamma-glutamyltranspeptidase / glutathione hydrolase